MRKTRNYLIPALGIACLAVSANAAIVNIFSDAGHETNFGSGTTAKTDPIPDPLSGAGWGIMSNSGLDGAALRFWDSDSTRATVRYHAPFTSGVQFNFDGIIEGGSAQNLWRFGQTGANVAGGASTAIDIRLRENGDLLINKGGNVFDTVDVGMNTRFSVSLVLNAAPTEGTSISYDQNGSMVSLGPQQYTVYVNDNVVGTYGFLVSTTDIGTAWFLTGTSAANSGAIMQIDNYEVRTGSDITAVPEPATYAMLTGLMGLGLVMLRRRRRS